MVATQFSLLAILCGASLGLAQPSVLNTRALNTAGGESCQLPPDEFNITAYQLYPENVAYDAQDCRLYLSVLYNASFAVYDIRRHEVAEVISFPGVTGNVTYHASGVRLDSKNRRLLGLTNAGAAFDSSGADISGPNDLVIYGLEEKRLLSTVHLNDFAPDGFRGFQDIDIDDEGNIFALGTYGGIILRINAGDEKDVKVWYKAQAPTLAVGVSGMGQVGDKKMVVASSGSRQLLRINMETPEEPLAVDLGPGVDIGNNTDGVTVPSEYENTVVLVADAAKGIMVIQSQDQWTTGKLLGTVPNRKFETESAFVTAVVDVNKALYVIHEYFLDGPAANQPAGTPGNRTDFPVTEITDEVRKLVLEKGVPVGQSPGAQASYQVHGPEGCAARGKADMSCG